MKETQITSERRHESGFSNLFKGIKGMKFFGNKGKGRHLLRNIGKRSKERTGAKRKWSRKKKALVIPAIILAPIMVVAASLYTYYKLAVKPPDVVQNPWEQEDTPHIYDPDDPRSTWEPSAQGGATGATGIVSTRDPNKFTFLILATDDGSNTDTIMVVTFDSANYTLDVVNIPRDTMANVSWSLKKVNSIYANMRVRHRGEDNVLEKAMDDTVEVFANTILGFPVDYWFMVDMRAFVALVNAVDGVDFYVPVNMNYDDEDGNLHIHYDRGMHHLYGRQALEVLRFRNTYASGDIRRISTQQDFLTAAAQQILARRSSINVFELAEIFIRYVKTDLPFNNLVWFGRQFLEMDADSITFTTMPGEYGDYVGPESYVTIFVEEWLELVNNTISPHSRIITENDVSILTRGADRRLYVTDGVYAGDPTWGSSSRGPSQSGGSGGATPNNTTNNTPSSPSNNTNIDPDDSQGENPDGTDDDPTDENPGYDPQEGGEDPSDYDPDAPKDPDANPPAEGEEQPPVENPPEIPSEIIDPLDEDPFEGMGG